FKAEDAAAGNGADAFDGWHGVHGGFRSDWTLSPNDQATLQGDLFGSSEGQTISTLFLDQLSKGLQTVNDKVAVGSGNILGRLTHTFANGSEASVQLYYDDFRRLDQALNHERTGDLDVQYHFQIGSRQDLVAGGGYRVTDQTYLNGYEVSFGTGHRTDTLSNVFLQDEVKITNSLALTLGTKLEHNDYTGFELEPSAQIAWTPTSRQTVWASVARAIRQPSWLDAQSNLDVATFPLSAGQFGVVQIQGSPVIQAEQLLDFEVGYRTQLNKRVSLDLVAFQSHYTNLRSQEPEPPYFALISGAPYLVTPSVFGNLAHAHDYGGELSANWDVTKRWRVSPGFSFLQMKIGVDPTSHDTTTPGSFGDSPKYQGQIRSALNLPHHLEWDMAAYYVSRLDFGPIPAYLRLETRLGWKFG
ncbi:MAG: TonB-dependent receptor plug domain-containing protein, partial [Candidatus Dormibacteraceae bacterium]